MLDILRDQLSETETTEFISMIEDAHSLLERFNLPDFENEFIELLALSDNSDSPTQEIYELTRNLQISLLRTHGIVINEESVDVRIPTMTKILEVILLIEDSSQAEEIESIIINASEPRDAVAQILNFFDSTLSVEEALQVITDVVHALPKRILEVIQKNLQGDILAETERVTPEYREFVKKVIDKIGMTHVYINATMYDRILSFDEYLYTLEDLIPEDHTKLNQDVYAKEIVSAAVISNAGAGNYLTVIKKHLENNTDFSLQLHTELLTKIERLCTEVLSFKPKADNAP